MDDKVKHEIIRCCERHEDEEVNNMMLDLYLKLMFQNLDKKLYLE